MTHFDSLDNVVFASSSDIAAQHGTPQVAADQPVSAPFQQQNLSVHHTQQMLVNQYNQYYMKLLANQQMQSRLIYMNEVPPVNEMNPMQFLESNYTQNMQYLSQLQAEAYNITQCLQ